MMAIYRRGSAHTWCGAEVKALTQLVPARLELTLPPNFFMVMIQQAGNLLSLITVEPIVSRGLLDRVSSSCTGANHISALTSVSHRIIFVLRFTIVLRVIRASSRNVSKLYTEHCVVHKESLLSLCSYCNGERCQTIADHTPTY